MIDDMNVSIPNVWADRSNISCANSGHRTVNIVFAIDCSKRANVSVIVVISCSFVRLVLMLSSGIVVLDVVVLGSSNDCVDNDKDALLSSLSMKLSLIDVDASSNSLVLEVFDVVDKRLLP